LRSLLSETYFSVKMAITGIHLATNSFLKVS
jgi:hypothetical protein